MDIPYFFHPRLILRTPRLPFPGACNDADIRSLLDDDAFMESIYLASPVLYNECIRWKAGELTDKKEVRKIILSLAKYYSRMSTRCTPFGLFSNCSVAEWHNGDHRIVLAADDVQRHTRLDMHYLCALAQHLAGRPAVKERLRFFPNNSIYQIDDEVRYIEYRYINGHRLHQISAVAGSDYVHKALAAAGQGATIRHIAAQLVEEDIQEADAVAFVEELIAAQLLVSELEPAITGEEVTGQVLRCLHRINQDDPHPGITSVITLLQRIQDHIQRLDRSGCNKIDRYKEIIALIRQLEVPFEEGKIFQTDLIRKTEQAGIDSRLQADLLKAFTILNALNPYQRNDNLRSFCRRFQERYEQRQMPLLEVLDTDHGIGYLENGSQDLSPLLDDLELPPDEEGSSISLKMDKVGKWLFSRLLEAHGNGDYSIEIKEEEISHLPVSWDDLPASIPLIFKIVDASSNTVLIESLAGTTATRMYGRFAHADKRIEEMAVEVAQYEQQMNSDVVFAEIVHLPESRLGNILLHPRFTDYEIPYLAASSVDSAHQVSLQDLYVSVVNDAIVLYSKRLNKRIIPLLSNAHNYSYKTLPVYQFLCELQSQHLRSAFTFSWSDVGYRFRFLPRVTHQRIILFPATWHFSAAEIKEITGIRLPAWEEEVAALRKKWNFPRYIMLADGDNELLVDLDNLLSVQCWIKTIRNRSFIIMREFLYTPPANTPAADSGYVTQLVASLVKKVPVHAGMAPARHTVEHSARSFSAGTEWLYFKFYCGVKAADKILEEAIAPLVAQLRKEGHIKKWFFIRYNDPGFHLRVRFCLTHSSQAGAVIALVNAFVKRFTETGIIYKSQLDTYEREIERYGASSIELAESCFCLDSDALLGLLQLTEGDGRESIRWLWSIRAVDELLDNFSYPLERKTALMEALKSMFATEFRVNKTLKLQLGKKYNTHKADIAGILDRQQDAGNLLLPLIRLIRDKSSRVQPLAAHILEMQADNTLQVPLDNLLMSYIHMLLNRLFPSKPRFHELVVYDMLYRHYHSLYCRLKQHPPLNLSYSHEEIPELPAV